MGYWKTESLGDYSLDKEEITNTPFEAVIELVSF